jgi:hypothetical protein
LHVRLQLAHVSQYRNPSGKHFDSRGARDGVDINQSGWTTGSKSLRVRGLGTADRPGPKPGREQATGPDPVATPAATIDRPGVRKFLKVCDQFTATY